MSREQTPNAKSKQRLEEDGYLVEITEKKERHRGGATKDLFGFMDLLAVHPDKGGALGVQATTDDHVSHRRRKILDDPELRHRLEVWLLAGNRFEIHGWRPEGGARIEEMGLRHVTPIGSR